MNTASEIRKCRVCGIASSGNPATADDDPVISPGGVCEDCALDDRGADERDYPDDE